MGRAGKSRGRGWNAIGDVIPVEKGPLRGSRSSFKLWRCRSSPSAPSTSSFFCLLDVRESRGVPRPCSGGPAFNPKHIFWHTFGSSGRPCSQRAPQLVFVEVSFSGVPRKTGRTELLLPPPQAQRRPHGAGLEPAGPRARPDRGAILTIQAGTPPRGPAVKAHRSIEIRGTALCAVLASLAPAEELRGSHGPFRGTRATPERAGWTSNI